MCLFKLSKKDSTQIKGIANPKRKKSKASVTEISYYMMPNKARAILSKQALASAMAIVLNLHYYLLLLVTLSSTFFLLPHNLATADDTLIEQQCRQTDAPTICIHCIKSHPEAAKKANKPETVAAILVTCLSDGAEILKGNMSTLASCTQDKNFKGDCEDCSKCFVEAKAKLSSATNALKKGDYDKANHILATALLSSKMIACGLKIERYKSKVPDDVYNMRIYKELTGVAMNIIDRLSYREKP